MSQFERWTWTCRSVAHSLPDFNENRPIFGEPKSDDICRCFRSRNECHSIGKVFYQGKQQDFLHCFQRAKDAILPKFGRDEGVQLQNSINRRNCQRYKGVNWRKGNLSPFGLCRSLQLLIDWQCSRNGCKVGAIWTYGRTKNWKLQFRKYFEKKSQFNRLHGEE